MKTIKRKYYILDIGTSTYDGVFYRNGECVISRSRNQTAIKAAINFLKEVL